MKISEKELRKMVKEIVHKKVNELKEASDFSARRLVVHSAESASMDFEKEIVALLGIVGPDEMAPNLQKQYYAVVEEMKSGIVKSVMEATRQLARFPKANSE